MATASPEDNEKLLSYILANLNNDTLNHLKAALNCYKEHLVKHYLYQHLPLLSDIDADLWRAGMVVDEIRKYKRKY